MWIDMMTRLGLDVHVIDQTWGEAADEERLNEVLQADKNKTIKAVCVVHNETATGVTADMGFIRRVMDDNKHPALLMVDGVSSIAALEFKMDDWGVDIAVTGSQKALSIPTGLAIVAVSAKALDCMKSAKLKRVYFDLQDMINANSSGNVPYTPSLPLLHGLQASLDLLRSEGMPNVIARHKRLADGTRAAVEGWGLQLLCKEKRWQSDTLTVVEVPAGVDSGRVVKEAYARYNLSLGLGLSKVAGKVFRIGHLGNMDEVMMTGGISGTEMALISAGVSIKPGSGISRAIDFWQKTSKVIRTREVVLK